MDDNLKSTAIHEAAHFVVERRLNGEEYIGGGITIVPHGSTLGVSYSDEIRSDRDPSNPEHQEEVRIKILVFLAGYVAQKYGGYSSTRQEFENSSDMEHVDLWLPALPGDPSHIKKELLEETRRLVVQDWAAIELIAVEVMEHGSLDEYECDFLFLIANGDESARETLRHLRWLKQGNLPPPPDPPRR